MELVGILSSVAMLVCLTLVLMSCASCKKLFKRKEKSSKKNEEQQEIKATEEEKAENGICNPAYDAAGVKACNKTPPSSENVEAKLNPDQENKCSSNGILEQDANSKSDSLKIEDECAPKRTPSTISLNEDQEDPEETTDDTAEASEVPPHKNRELTSSNSVESENSIHPFKFSESIRSTDVANLSFALSGRTKEPIEEEIDVASSNEVTSERKLDDIQPDLTRFDDVVFQGGWRKDVKLKDLLELKLIDEEVADDVLTKWKESKGSPNKECVHKALKPFLFGETPVAGILFSETGETKSIFRSAKDGILRRGTAISLLEAQAATGNVIDPVSGRKMSVSEGFQLGLLDKVYESVVSRAERAVTGYTSRVTDEVMSLGQAMNRGLVVESHGIRLLEAQLATGGIIDHKSNIKLPIDVATSRGLLDEKLAQKLIDACEDISDEQKADNLKTFFDPNTEENVTYRELMRRSILDENTGMRLYPLEKIGRKKLNHATYSGLSSLSSSRASSRDSIPAAIASEK